MLLRARPAAAALRGAPPGPLFWKFPPGSVPACSRARAEPRPNPEREERRVAAGRAACTAGAPTPQRCGPTHSGVALRPEPSHPPQRRRLLLLLHARHVQPRPGNSQPAPARPGPPPPARNPSPIPSHLPPRRPRGRAGRAGGSAAPPAAALRAPPSSRAEGGGAWRRAGPVGAGPRSGRGLERGGASALRARYRRVPLGSSFVCVEVRAVVRAETTATKEPKSDLRRCRAVPPPPLQRGERSSYTTVS